MSALKTNSTKTVYKPMVLKSFGSLSELTKGGAGTAADGGMSLMM